MSETTMTLTTLVPIVSTQDKLPAAEAAKKISTFLKAGMTLSDIANLYEQASKAEAKPKSSAPVHKAKAAEVKETKDAAGVVHSVTVTFHRDPNPSPEKRDGTARKCAVLSTCTDRLSDGTRLSCNWLGERF